MQTLIHPLRLSALLLVFLALAGALIPSTAAVAQEGSEEIDFRILKFDCTSPPPDSPPLTEQVPEQCDEAEGVSFTVEDENGNTIASCETNADGFCIVQVPNEATVTVIEDESTATDGFSPRENPITTQAVTEFAGAVFVNLPDAPELPEVGAGTTATSARTPLWAALACGLGCLFVALALRRRMA